MLSCRGAKVESTILNSTWAIFCFHSTEQEALFNVYRQTDRQTVAALLTTCNVPKHLGLNKACGHCKWEGGKKRWSTAATYHSGEYMWTSWNVTWAALDTSSEQRNYQPVRQFAFHLLHAFLSMKIHFLISSRESLPSGDTANASRLQHKTAKENTISCQRCLSRSVVWWSYSNETKQDKSISGRHTDTGVISRRRHDTCFSHTTTTPFLHDFFSLQLLWRAFPCPPISLGQRRRFYVCGRGQEWRRSHPVSGNMAKFSHHKTHIQELRVIVTANRGSLDTWIRTTSKSFAEMLAQCSKPWLPYILVSGCRKFHFNFGFSKSLTGSSTVTHFYMLGWIGRLDFPSSSLVFSSE